MSEMRLQGSYPYDSKPSPVSSGTRPGTNTGIRARINTWGYVLRAPPELHGGNHLGFGTAGDPHPHFAPLVVQPGAVLIQLHVEHLQILGALAMQPLGIRTCYREPFGQRGQGQGHVRSRGLEPIERSLPPHREFVLTALTE
jgi:hypothetical protein